MRTSIKDYHRIWTMARLRSKFFAEQIENEELADQQLALELSALEGIAQTTASSFEDLRIKIDVLISELMESGLTDEDCNSQTLIARSLQNDLVVLCDQMEPVRAAS